MYEFLQLVHVLAYKLVQLIRPALVPICCVAAWSFVGIGIWGLVAAVRDSLQRARRMHQIPCARCRYFSGNYLLKCPVHPDIALSETAIGCSDFEKSCPEWQANSSLRRGT